MILRIFDEREARTLPCITIIDKLLPDSQKHLFGTEKIINKIQLCIYLLF